MFPLLYTLHQCGFLDKVGENQYRLASEVRRGASIASVMRRRANTPPSSAKSAKDSARAAEREHVELLTVDNRYQPKIALRNADYLIKEQVDLVIEFQTDEMIAPAIATKYLEANIPFIAIDIPHPGAIYFGANNYQAGLIGGRFLGRWAKRTWDGEVDEILLIELQRAGSLPQARIRGLSAGLTKSSVCPRVCKIVSVDGDGQFQTSLERVRKHLRQSQAKHVLVGAANDSSALGALRAYEEAGRANECVVVGQNGEPEARAELRPAARGSSHR